jgi:hypothetical protein
MGFKKNIDHEGAQRYTKAQIPGAALSYLRDPSCAFAVNSYAYF